MEQLSLFDTGFYDEKPHQEIQFTKEHEKELILVMAEALFELFRKGQENNEPE